MTRDEFKKNVSDFIDSLVPEDRELNQEDENTLNDQLGETASDIFNEEDMSPESES